MSSAVRAPPPTQRDQLLSTTTLSGPVQRTLTDSAWSARTHHAPAGGPPPHVSVDVTPIPSPGAAALHNPETPESGFGGVRTRGSAAYNAFPMSSFHSKDRSDGDSSGPRHLKRFMCCAGRLHSLMRSLGFVREEGSHTDQTQLLVCACAAVAALLVLLLAAVGFLIVVFVVILPDTQWQLRQTIAPFLDHNAANPQGSTGGGSTARTTTPPSPFDFKRVLAASGLKQFLQQAHEAELLRRSAMRNATILAAVRRAQQNGQAHTEGDLVSLVRSLPELEALSAQLLRVSVYVQAVQAHDPSLGLVELSDFLLNVKGRRAALERAAAQARREAANATTAATNGGGNGTNDDDDAAAEWSAALKESFAGRAEAARVRAQMRGFVGVPAAQAERWTRQPFDDVAMLRYRHAWTQSEVVPRLVRAAGAAPTTPVPVVRAYDVASRAAAKADVYEASSIFNHVHYYPLRRYTAMRSYSPETVADTDAWYSEVAAGVQARFGAALTVNAVAAGAATVPDAARASPLSLLSMPMLSTAREAEVAHLQTEDDAQWMPGALRADSLANTQTIFISLASYRDSECPPTLLDLFRVARNPHRVYVGLAQQNGAGDTRCLLPEMYGPLLCPSSGRDGGDAFAAAREAEARRHSLRGPGIDLRAKYGAGSGAALFDERVCFLSDHVRVRDIDSRQAKGPTYGRYMAMLLYRGEDLTMILDSHNKFRPMWDTLGAAMLALYKEPKVALSHYPEAYAPNMAGFETYKLTTAYLCKAFFMKLYGYPRLNGIVIGSPGDFVQNNKYNDAYAVEKSDTITKASNFRLPQPWVAGGFLLTYATIFRDVPFDPHLPYVFDGEEVLYSMRLWTHGYNIYSPPRGLCFHIYGRAKAPRVWSESNVWYPTQDRVRPRIQFFLQSHQKNNANVLVPANTTNVYAVVDSSRFGMGRQRTVAQWYEYAGGNPVNYTFDGKWCGVDTTDM